MSYFTRLNALAGVLVSPVTLWAKRNKALITLLSAFTGGLGIWAGTIKPLSSDVASLLDNGTEVRAKVLLISDMGGIYVRQNRINSRPTIDEGSFALMFDNLSDSPVTVTHIEVAVTPTPLKESDLSQRAQYIYTGGAEVSYETQEIRIDDKMLTSNAARRRFFDIGALTKGATSTVSVLKIAPNDSELRLFSPVFRESMATTLAACQLDFRIVYRTSGVDKRISARSPVDVMCGSIGNFGIVKQEDTTIEKLFLSYDNLYSTWGE